MIVGDYGVGKSSIISRYADSNFTTKYKRTIGIDFRCKTIQLGESKLTLKLQIWDAVNGRNQFEAMQSIYYRDANGIMICFDITNRESFSGVKNWLFYIDKRVPKSVVKMLIGTKCDLDNREVTTQEAEEYAKSLNINYIELSSKSNINVDKAFYELVLLTNQGIYTGTIPPIIPNRQFFVDYCKAQKIKLPEKQAQKIKLPEKQAQNNCLVS